MISEIQSKKIRHLFRVLDHNDNLILQPDDFTNVARKISKSAGINADSDENESIMVHAYRIFIQFLTDLQKHDEMEITRDEFVHFFEQNLDGLTATEDGPIDLYVTRIVHYIFNLFDKNGDGFISKDEYVRMFRIYGIDTTYSESSFAKLDLNGDGVLSMEELTMAFKEFFLSTDPAAPGNWIFGKWDY